MLGCGVGVGFTRSGGLGPGWLENRLRQHLGSTLTGLWGLDEPTLSSGLVTAIPARVGTALAGASTRVRTAINGRPAVGVGAAGGVKALAVNDGLIGRSWFVVAEGHVTAADFEVLLYTHNMLGYPFSGSNAASQAFYSGGGDSHRVNDVATAAIPTSGFHVFQSSKAGNTYTGVNVGASLTIQVWGGAIGVIVRADAVPSAGVASAIVADLRRYYRLT